MAVAVWSYHTDTICGKVLDLPRDNIHQDTPKAFPHIKVLL